MARAYATLVCTDAYAVGAQVLRSSLLRAGSTLPLVVLVTSSVSAPVRAHLTRSLENALVYDVAAVPLRADQVTRYAFARFQHAWAKLRVFELEMFDTVVFLDADMLCLRNMDELFDAVRPETTTIAASRACTCNPQRIAHYPTSWTSASCSYTETTTEVRRYFNSGMFVLHPSRATLQALLAKLQGERSVERFVFSDQCFLNEAFPDFIDVPYVFNALKTLPIAHPRLWQLKEVKAIHYILEKPWHVDGLEDGPYADLYALCDSHANMAL
ncbi:hypothetical protein SPRG_10957 [Saprolegnia parasitica CBS 223.65]|uniref:Uncharacterized protein n=1 Tax=Saprolegnia parasitica (strain CBS 223.65) TaxID=695850 RepID=A0A067BUE3_SAPPC|nr:hypothetical protein SPRG_10957 [Saprolegnia parasitica CBS 223.65]KDO22139.1 hypothetical protein SPRG_10957 [Saprolegnia parasitica CBS 223.65]|eukprot:XP_012207177.1 hypothetical protein SPRG_10957 [Saprolegnia parasitica CBS 223.65]